MTTANPSPQARHGTLEPWRIVPLCLPLLLVVCFSLSTDVSRWFQTWEGNRTESGNLMAVALGDARRMFANHFFVKADAYFHSGFYPTIYDNRQSYKTPHIGADAGIMEGKNTGEEHSFLGAPRNWIDRFGREFYPSAHTHLDEGGADNEDKDGVREMLPWLKLSAELDPKRVETYTVTAFWLRRMNHDSDAEEFLREGLKANPGHPQLLFELGRLFYEFRHDTVRARNVWEMALAKIPSLPEEKPGDNRFLLEQIVSNLASLEEHENNFPRALNWLELLEKYSPQPEKVQQWRAEVQKKMASQSTSPSSAVTSERK